MLAGNSTFFFKLSTATVLSALLFSGCDAPPWQSASTLQEESSSKAVSLRSTEGQQPTSPQESYDSQQNDGTNTLILTQPHVSGKTLDAGASAGILPNKAASSKSSVDAASSWNPDEPALHGLSVGETRETAEKRYGKPIDEYIMKDDNGPLAICEFDGFTVGYDENGKIMIVEVVDASVNTGLNGLVIGDTEEEAVKSLGKPDNHTDYVISYNTKNTLLKMDLDPEDDSILSIKLFSSVPKP